MSSGSGDVPKPFGGGLAEPLFFCFRGWQGIYDDLHGDPQEFKHI